MAKYADRRGWMVTAAEAKLGEIKREEAATEKVREIYRKANRDIQARVLRFYDELATEDETNTWRFEGLNTPATLSSAKKLREKIESSGLTEYVPERLQRKLSVLETLELDNWYTMTKAGQDSHKIAKNALSEQISQGGQIWQNAISAGAGNFVGFDRNQIGYMLGENWRGGNFSSRLWDENQAAWKDVQEEIAKAIASGQDPATTRRKLANILGPAYRGNGPKGVNYAVERIIRTELARAATNADIIQWRREGVTEIQWNARLESNTCDHCAERDGRVYKLDQPHDEVPLHPNCRCFLTPYDRVAEEARDDRVRQYKDKDGEYQEVEWAPMQAIAKKTKQGWVLRNRPLAVSDYFWTSSPWMQYEPSKSGVKFAGEIDDAYTALADRAVKGVIDLYPEVGVELRESYDNTIYEHRGTSVTLGKGLDTIGGVVYRKAEKGQVGVALAYPSTLTGTAKAIRSKMAEIAAKQYAQGYWSTNKVQHTIVHEMGHVLENYIRRRGGEKALTAILKDAAGTRNITTAMEIMEQKVSRYAGKNYSEAFAELFAKSVVQDALSNDQVVARFVTALDQTRSTLPREKRKTKINISAP